jgi:hypothetical protein
MAIKTDSQRAMEALVGGKDPIQEVYGESSGEEEIEESLDLPEEEEPADDGQDEDILSLLNDQGDSEESTEEVDEQEPDNDTTDPEPVKQEAEAKEDQVEFIKAAGKQIKIDYNDRARIKRAFAGEAGMRKFQRERDDLTKQVESLKESAESYNKLDEIYQTQGVAGVVEKLEGRTLDEIVQERIDRMILEHEKPEEAARLKHEEELAAERRQREALQRKMESELERSRAEREAAEETKLEGMIKPVFTRYSFSGKLGDETAEHQMDQALWNQAIDRLEALPDDIELTPALVRREFRAVANTFNKIINKQAESQTQKISRAKKTAAAENVQSAAASGTAAASNRSDFVKKYKSGDLKGSLVDLLTGKVKL